MAVSRLEKIKAKHQGPIRFYQRVQPDDLTWLIEQVESSRRQIMQMANEIEDAHYALTDKGVVGCHHKKLLAERIKQINSSKWTPVGRALSALYETYHATEQPSTWRRAVHDLMKAYDDWLD